MAEHTFYLAEAHIVGIKSATEYRVWLLDHRSEDWIEDYLAGRHGVPDAHCINVNLAYTLDNPGPAGEIHFLKEYGALGLITELNVQAPISEMVRGRVAIHESLWNQIPPATLPLPPLPNDHADRLKIMTRDNGGAVEAFFGYHVKVLDIKNSFFDIEFLSWTDDVHGNTWCDLSSHDFDAASSQITPSSQKGDQGRLFVSLDYIARMKFLELPKVPYNAGG